MQFVDKFRQTLTKEDFERIPKHIQRQFYEMAIKCKCEHTTCKKVVKFYDVLLLNAGVFGRKELSAIIDLLPSQKIPESIKAMLKMTRISTLIQNKDPKTVYFFDDNETIISEVSKLGINAISVKDTHLTFDHLISLIRKKINSNSVSLVLIDFDKTFSVHRFKKRYNILETDTILNRFFGGKHRVKLLFHGLKKLEELEVDIGFVTFHTKNSLLDLLIRFGWMHSGLDL